jgi:hypothetical protein
MSGAIPRLCICLHGVDWDTFTFTSVTYIDIRVSYSAVLSGPCHHGMARPRVADRGTASS